MRARHALPLFTTLVAVACRLWALELMPLSYDRGFPLGLGIFIRDALGDGRFGDLPWMSLVASINLRNPAGASWLWAAISAIDANPYVATVLVALLHAVVVTAVAHRIAAQLFGEPAGITAGLLAASSPWAAWVARGPWLQGTLEALSALSAWLLFCGLYGRSPRRLFAGLLTIAAALHTYLAAFGLLAQALVALLHDGFERSRRQKTLGILALLISTVWIAGAFFAARGDVRAAIDNPNAVNTDLQPGELNLDPLRHTLRIVSGRDFENTFGDVAHAGWRDSFGDAQSTLLDACMLLGVLLAASRAASRAASGARMRFALLWLLTPIAITFFIANVVMREWKVHVFYLTLASPMMYVFAAAPLQLANALPKNLRTHAAWLAAALLTLMHGTSAVANQASDVAVRRADPSGVRAAEGIATGAAARLGRALAAQCAAVLSIDDDTWLTSWIGSSKLIRTGALRADATSAAALVESSGRTCLVQTSPLVPLPDVFDERPLAVSAAADMQPVVALEAVPAEPVLYTVNLGWSLLRLETPSQARPGDEIIVRHVWRVDALPPEAHASWYFAPFVNLVAPDGSRIAIIDGAQSLLGYVWRPGAQIHSVVHLKIPTSAAPGDYTLEISLFDPNQKKNAVYFDPLDPAAPVVVLQRTLVVREE